MLLSLSIRNYALIEDLNIDFTDGFTVITGETGSGKSILIKSIELLTGARADSSSIRTGCSVCTITGVFEYNDKKTEEILESLSVPLEDKTIIIRRVIENTGKSKAFINDIPVNISTLSQIGDLLIDFHKQDEKHSLLDNTIQLNIIDKEIDDISLLLEECSKAYFEVKELSSKIDALNLSDAEREMKIDLYSFQVNEIEEAALESGEDEKIENELPKLKNAEKIASLSEETISLLYSDDSAALSNILKAKKNISNINSFGSDASEALSLIEQSYYQVEEAYREIEKILSKTDLNPEKLNNAIERLELIKKLKKKYGKSIEEINIYKDNIKAELENLQNYKNNASKLEKELIEKEKVLNNICEKISQKRKKSANDFAKKVKKELTSLEIPNALFDISFQKKDPSENGYDQIEFMFSANKGEKILPLKNVASGGELSRLMLAIEISSKLQNMHTLIFDEIDTGTGGKTGEKIGRKLYELSNKKQVFSITHLAQVAAFAKTHIKIYKETEKSRTYTKAKVLSKDEHIQEIARMVSGELITENALNLAKQLISSSK